MPQRKILKAHRLPYKQKDQTLTGKFTGTLKNLTTNEFVEVSGASGHVRLIK